MEREDLEEGLPPVDDPGNCKPPPRLEKQVTFSKETREGEGEGAGAGAGGAGGPPLGEYNMAVSRLNAALSTLQTDMQRLSQQQRQLMRRPPTTAAWVIPARPKPTAASAASSAPVPRLSRESARDLPPASASSSPSPSRRANRYAHTTTPSQTLQIAQISPGDDRALLLLPAPGALRPPEEPQAPPRPAARPQVPAAGARAHPATERRHAAPPAPGVAQPVPETGSSEEPGIFTLELETGPLPCPLPAPAPPRPPGQKEPGEGGGGGSSSGAPSECSFESDVAAVLGGKRSSLLEISLSSLRSAETGADGFEEGPDVLSDSTSDHTDPELGRGGVGFFYKDEARPEDEMAQRRAALLEKQQKRTEEMKKRREQEREREASPAHRRGGFTRQEYQRRHQLKIMDDLDKVLRQRPAAARAARKQRPKTVFHDDSALSRSPAKSFMGSKLTKVYSHSSLNLSSMANDSGNNRRSPSQSHSPSRLMSPSRLANQNGEKDWENESTASSPASIPEYTGPKLYKEPSFKSNKFIIHNALSRCCLAGKVNEQQRSKIVEEMDKCPANHFLILFRDSSCQFRAVYTMSPESEEMVRLTGIGPRVISTGTVESIYKYSSDRKQFSAIPSKTMSMSVDAFTIPGHLWYSKRPATPKKPGTPK
ncbi:hypothetical protein AAFF_G00199870 [Aldrovandia affinis]|uniref:CKK domain-containing protein n=1 Tax=Aldrovandia affinis TaxID=143900 RepID=A0AAD7RIE8_9TELE|nr:hypothetical protein AAFF_G00199870 [Aldrovandia affinis]